jgi:hypothetical protein
VYNNIDNNNNNNNNNNNKGGDIYDYISLSLITPFVYLYLYNNNITYHSEFLVNLAIITTIMEVIYMTNILIVYQL